MSPPASTALRKDIRVAHLALAHKARDVRIFEKECRSLAEAGYDVYLLAPDAPDGEKLNGVSMRSVDVPRAGNPASRWTRRLANVTRVARGLQAHIYHLHEPELIPVGLALQRTGAKIIYDAHEDAPVEAWSLNAERPLRKLTLPPLWWSLLSMARLRFDAFVAVTPHIARTFPASRTIEARNYPRSEMFALKPGDGLPRRPHAIFAGLVSRTRGAMEMLDALTALPAGSDIRLQLFGTIDTPKLEEEMRRHLGWQRVDFVGHQPWRTVLEEYGRATAGLLLYAPAREQQWALPVKLFEFLLAGLPVISSDNAYWREFLAGNPAVTFVRHGDAKGTADALVRLAKMPLQEARALGRAGAEHAMARYSWNSEAARLVGLYDRLARIPSAAAN
jgi:glycosyltransferase involved in cell wall biosynthesis